MGYIFNAWLEEGAPRLRVINPRNGATTLTWNCPTMDSQDDSVYRQEIQNLFKRLLLLASAQDGYFENLSNPDSSLQRRNPAYVD